MNSFKCLFYIIVVIGSLNPNALLAQKTYVQEEQTWLGMFNQVRLSNRWGLWHDIHFRLKDNFIKEPSQFLIRVGPTFYINDDVRFTVAYNFINHFPDETHKNISQPEHRPFQQIQWYARYGKTRLMQWIRLDERFRRKIKNDNELADGYNFNWRVRYNFALFIPLSKKGLAPKTLQLLLNDEIMVNAGKNIVYNYFDQNRFFAGFNYQFTKESQLQFGYMNLFQQQAAGNKYRQQHTIRLFYFHNFDLRHK
ncbi:MAG: DUF2490 domain-containing protein [Saprospiraceae bacterium]|nr:DUF2490 domain-containing protein [Saprospiraceae bacterium]